MDKSLTVTASGDAVSSVVAPFVTTAIAAAIVITPTWWGIRMIIGLLVGTGSYCSNILLN